MDMLKLVRKVNNKAVNTALIYSVIYMLGLNFLLYSFFDLNSLRNLLRLGAAGLIMILLLFRLTEGSLRQRQVFLLLLAGWQIVSGGTSGLNFAFLLMLTTAVAGYRHCRIHQVVFRVMVVLTGLVLLSLLLGIEKNEVYTVGKRTRHMLGFINVNSASIFFMIGLSSYLLMREEKAKLTDLGAVLALETVVFLFTDSRTPMLCIFLMVLLIVLLPRIPRKWAGKLLYFGIALLFVTPYLWLLPAVNSPLVNKVLSLRPLYFDAYFREQSALTYLFGATRQAELDNAYLLILFGTGLVVYLTVYFAVQSAAKQMLNGKRHVKLAFLIMMLCCSVMESAAVRPELLCAIVLWVMILEEIPGKGRESILLTRGREKLLQWIRNRGKQGVESAEITNEASV